MSAQPTPPPSQAQNCIDFDALLELPEYDSLNYQSPAVSSPGTGKFSRSTSATPSTNNALAAPGSQPSMAGPSHQYDMYRQQTGLLPGAVANTLAVNQSNIHINGQNFGMDYLPTMSPNDELIDFGTSPNAFSPGYVNPSAISGQDMSMGMNQGGNVRRLWPGMHQQQAALAKAQAQKQQQQLMQQRQQTRPQRKVPPASDPVVEEKISQLLSSMRQSSIAAAEEERLQAASVNPLAHVQRARKDEEEMDEDERLLASEEGKKLSSKERRQLRNKVSARAFRSRRKEYITQLEGEIAGKVNENSDLRVQNRALLEENQRLSDLTRMLLSSSAFSSFVDTLSTNPTAQPAVAPAPVEQRLAENRQVPKDVNPYAAQQQMQQQHVGMTIVPEQAVDFSVLDINTDGFGYQPRVFSVFAVPESPLDAAALSGKSDCDTAESDKMMRPVIEAPPTDDVDSSICAAPVPVDEEFDGNPNFALYTDAAVAHPADRADEQVGEVEVNLEAADDTASLVEADAAMARVRRICAKLDAAAERLEAMTRGL